MPRETVYIKVSQGPLNNREQDKTTAAFEAGRWLAYADQTDTIGYEAFIKSAHYIDGATHITAEVPVLHGDKRLAFINEMETLSRVEEIKFDSSRL